jgi:hypothetical protein
MILMAISRVPPFGRPQAGDGIKATGLYSVEFNFARIMTEAMLPFAAVSDRAKHE